MILNQPYLKKITYDRHQARQNFPPKRTPLRLFERIVDRSLNQILITQHAQNPRFTVRDFARSLPGPFGLTSLKWETKRMRNIQFDKLNDGNFAKVMKAARISFMQTSPTYTATGVHIRVDHRRWQYTQGFYSVPLSGNGRRQKAVAAGKQSRFMNRISNVNIRLDSEDQDDIEQQWDIFLSALEELISINFGSLNYSRTQNLFDLTAGLQNTYLQFKFFHPETETYFRSTQLEATAFLRFLITNQAETFTDQMPLRDFLLMSATQFLNDSRAGSDADSPFRDCLLVQMQFNNSVAVVGGLTTKVMDQLFADSLLFGHGGSQGGINFNELEEKVSSMPLGLCLLDTFYRLWLATELKEFPASKGKMSQHSAEFVDAFEYMLHPLLAWTCQGDVRKLLDFAEETLNICVKILFAEDLRIHRTCGVLLEGVNCVPYTILAAEQQICLQDFACFNCGKLSYTVIQNRNHISLSKFQNQRLVKFIDDSLQRKAIQAGTELFKCGPADENELQKRRTAQVKKWALNEPSKKVTRFLSWDIETLTQQSLICGNQQPYMASVVWIDKLLAPADPLAELWLPVCKTLIFEGYRCVCDMISWMLGTLREVDKIYAWSFNGAMFDHKFIVDAFEQMPMDLARMVFVGAPLEMKSIVIDGKLTFLDFCQIYPGSLVAVSRTLTRDLYGDRFCQKAAGSDFTMTTKIWEQASPTKKAALQSYCLQDSLMLMACVEVYVKFLLLTKFNGFHLTKFDWYSTSQLAFSLFTTCYLEWELEGDTLEVLKAINPSYHGGAVLVFRIFSTIQEQVFVNDINSHYPKAMLAEMPYKLRARVTVYLREHSTYNDADLYHIRYLKISEKCHYPNIPVMTESGLVYPLLVEDQYVWGCELAVLQKFNFVQLLYVDQQFDYETKPLFRKFIEDIYERRKIAKRNKQTVIDSFMKLLMNSTYGKFAQRQFPTTKIISNYQLMTLLSTMSSAEQEALKMFPISDTWTKLEYPAISQVSKIGQCKRIASYITANSRSRLFEVLFTLPPESVFYVDTDSIFTNCPLPEDLYDELELGKWKLEGIAREPCYFVAPKFYQLNGYTKTGDSEASTLTKIKGVNRNIARAMQTNLRDALIDRHIKTDALTTFRKGYMSIQIEQRTKNLTAVVKKRRLNELTGMTTPFETITHFEQHQLHLMQSLKTERSDLQLQADFSELCLQMSSMNVANGPPTEIPQLCDLDASCEIIPVFAKYTQLQDQFPMNVARKRVAKFAGRIRRYTLAFAKNCAQQLVGAQATAEGGDFQDCVQSFTILMWQNQRTLHGMMATSDIEPIHQWFHDIITRVHRGLLTNGTVPFTREVVEQFTNSNTFNRILQNYQKVFKEMQQSQKSDFLMLMESVLSVEDQAGWQALERRIMCLVHDKAPLNTIFQTRRNLQIVALTWEMRTMQCSTIFYLLNDEFLVERLIPVGLFAASSSDSPCTAIGNDPLEEGRLNFIFLAISYLHEQVIVEDLQRPFIEDAERSTNAIVARNAILLAQFDNLFVSAPIPRVEDEDLTISDFFGGPQPEPFSEMIEPKEEEEEEKVMYGEDLETYLPHGDTSTELYAPIEEDSNSRNSTPRPKNGLTDLIEQLRCEEQLEQERIFVQKCSHQDIADDYMSHETQTKYFKKLTKHQDRISKLKRTRIGALLDEEAEESCGAGEEEEDHNLEEGEDFLFGRDSSGKDMCNVQKTKRRKLVAHS